MNNKDEVDKVDKVNRVYWYLSANLSRGYLLVLYLGSQGTFVRF